MGKLVHILEGMGCENIKTYIQSGNVVFHSARKEKRRFAAEISSMILKTRGFAPKVLLLEISDLQEAIDNNPFTTTDGGFLHFFFLELNPTKPDLEGLQAVKSKSEKFSLNKRTFYLHAPDGIGRSKLAAKVEQGLGVPATARNWNTVSKLMSMVDQ
jgi:uncharacterized protein (DUF1697 family)